MTSVAPGVRLEDAKGPLAATAAVSAVVVGLAGLQGRAGSGVPPLASLIEGPRHLTVPLVVVAVLAVTVGAVGRWRPERASSAPRRALEAGLAASAWFVVAAALVTTVVVGGLLLAGSRPHLGLASVAGLGAMVARLALTAGALGMLAGVCCDRRAGPIAAMVPLLVPFLTEAVAAALSGAAEPLLAGGSWAVLAAGDGPTAEVSVTPGVVHAVMAVAWIGLPAFAFLVAALPLPARR